jgi:hypothetical protein
MTIKTYTNRSNARRAAIATGAPAELVQITVHKKEGEVRFGWKTKEVQIAQPEVAVSVCSAIKRPSVSPGGTIEKRPQRALDAAPREERNGVKRPRAGGLCAQVWTWMDAQRVATIKDARAAAAEHGWNENNVASEFYAWRKFHGLSGRTKTTRC